MKKGTIKSVAAMLCVAAIGVVPVFANGLTNIFTTNSASLTDSTSVTVSDPVVGVEYQIGDVNRDGDTTLEDTLIVLRAALYLNISQLDEQQLELANIDQEGDITLKDAILSLRQALNISADDDDEEEAEEAEGSEEEAEGSEEEAAEAE